MSDNPFANPDPIAGGNAPKAYKKAPAALTAIMIICLVLGILGLLGVCLGGVGLAMQGSMAGLQGAGGDPAQQAFQKQMEELQQQQMIPNIIMLAMNFIAAPLLTIGAIGGLGRKSWGWSLLGFGLIAAIFYQIVKMILTIYIQITMMGQMGDAMQKMVAQQGGGGAPDQAAAEAFATAMQVGMWIGVAVAVIWGLALLAFYIWSWTYLKKDTVKSYFGVA